MTGTSSRAVALAMLLLLGTSTAVAQPDVVSETKALSVLDKPLPLDAVPPAETAPTSATPAAEPGVDIARGAMSGRVRLVENDKVLASVEDVAVYFRADEPVVLEPPSEPATMTTVRKRFEPRVLPLMQGTAVQFPNRDPILHNVFSLSPGNQFDLGLYGPEGEETYVFNELGLVRVYCNVHQSMVAHVLVLDTPYFTVADGDGYFELDNVVTGPGTLYVWHERARRVWTKKLDGPMDAIAVELDLTTRRVPEHTNKFGKSYRRSRDRRDRY